ncbi:hypothetical protein [Helicobacter cetorum]|uniref:Uncharacterized protein n=1 Tax=Helicobacter cetorum (strain ATCC BAA-540 / CCUG 52418 / MIT 99-5656) TaxID=1163745 RepID=I0EUF1_HELCM|nr:hypothetical protein [Helicobacter cetorum]AFI06570.1 hypothetical protein HCD_07915 [Helicobacter cetorum MIT 99-5656]
MEFKNTKKGNSMDNETLSELDSRFEEAHKTNKEDKKKAYTLWISEQVMNDLEEHLKEFGAFKESKSMFIQNAIVFYLEHKKKEMKQMLLDKASRL